MSIQAVLGTGDPSGPLVASERAEHLRALVAQVEAGPAGFAAALDAAQAGSATTPGPTDVGSAPGGAVPSTLPASNPAGGQGTVDPAAEQSNYPLSAAGAGEVSTASGSSAPSAYLPLIDAAAARNGLDPAVLYGLIQQESGFDPSATSSAGAVGLTQLMPGTASSQGVTEPLNPAQSIEGGARYLGQMLRQFGGNVTDALAAYNAGPGAVQSYGGVPPYSETQQYVTKVLENAAAERQRLSQNVVGADSVPDATASARGTAT